MIFMHVQKLQFNHYVSLFCTLHNHKSSQNNGQATYFLRLPTKIVDLLLPMHLPKVSNCSTLHHYTSHPGAVGTLIFIFYSACGYVYFTYLLPPTVSRTSTSTHQLYEKSLLFIGVGEMGGDWTPLTMSLLGICPMLLM